MAADIIIRIGAAQDRSVDTVFGDIEKRSRRAFETAKKESGNSARALKADNNALVLSSKQVAANELKVQRDMYRERSRLNRATAVEQLRTERALALQLGQINRQRSRDRMAAISQEEKAERDYQRRLVSMQQNAQREQSRATRNAARERAREEYKQSREIDRFATRTSHRATRFFFPRPEGALGYSKRIAGDLMRGAGVDFSLSGGVARAREREMAGMGLAQQERIATGKSEGGAAWAAKSLAIGTDLSTEPEQVTAMIRAMTGKTGDFDNAAKSAKELASMTLASGANMDEMGAAAGYVYNQLKGMPGAADMTLTVMRGIVGQTAVGAVEMEEYAKQMGRIAANAKMFEGGVDKNILELSALTQLSIAEGGATSGADAARSIAAFANTTSKGQRINAFKKHGVDLFNDTGTQKRPIMEIIKDSLLASKGNIPAMTQMWADTLGQKPIRGLTNAFNEAGGGEAGWQAALKKIQPFMDAQLSKETEQRNIADYQSTTTAKAANFQLRLDAVTSSLSARLLPALEQLAPQAIKLANTFADAVSWAAGNPWSAVMALLGASVARAAAESFGRLALERGIMGLTGGAGVGSSGAGGLIGGAGLGGGTAGSVVGALGAIGAAALAGAAAFAVTTAALEAANKAIQGSDQEQKKKGNATFFGFNEEYAAAKTDEEREAAVKRAKFNLQQTRDNSSVFSNRGEIYDNSMSAINASRAQIDARRTAGEDQSAFQQATGQSVTANDIGIAVARELTGVLTKNLNVRVTNTSDFKLYSDTVGNGQDYGPPTVAQ